MKLAKKTKIILTILCLVLAGAALASGLYAWRVPKYVEKEETYYSFQSKGKLDYRLFLQPNTVYEQPFLPKEQNYILKFIDYLEAQFAYHYEGSAEAELTTDFRVTANLRGLHGKDNEVLWSKEYILVPQTVEEEKTTVKNVELSVPVDLNDFIAIKERVFASSEVNSPVELELVFTVQTAATTAKGNLTDTITANLIIPIGETVFKIESNPEVTNEDALTITERHLVPANTLKVSILLMLSFIFGSAAIALITLVKPADPPDVFVVTTNQIFKEHGERLAEMEHAIPYKYSDIINIRTIEDMVKIADEVGQPVLYYKVDTALERKIEFHVFDVDRVYYMVIFGEIKAGLIGTDHEIDNSL